MLANFMQSVSNVISRVSIRSRILSMVLVSALGFALVGLLYSVGNRRTEGTFLVQSQYSEQVRLILLASEKAARLRQIEGDFRHHRTRPYAQRFREVAGQLRTDLSTANAVAAANGQAVGVAAVADGMESYFTGVEQLIALQTRIGLDESFVAIGADGRIAAADTFLSISVDNAALRLLKRLNDELDFGQSVELLEIVTHYYRMRELQGRYFLAAKDDDRQLFEAELRKLRAKLGAASIEDGAKSEVTALADAYATAFAHWADARRELDAKAAELAAHMRRLEQQFAALVASAEQGRSGAIAGHEATRRSIDFAIGATIIAALLSSLLIGLVVALSIIRPLQRVVRAMRGIVAGNPGVDLSCVQGHEIGEMFAAVRVFSANTAERVRLEFVGAQEREKESQRQAHMERLVEGFRGEIAEVAATLEEQMRTMRASAGTLNQVAEMAASDAVEAGNASHAASDNVDGIAASAGKLAAAIREISAQSDRSRDLVRRAQDVAGDTEREFTSLEEKALRIGSVVDIIRAIADQTNLLALNATIEAARAGEAGRGFAIVAGEVKQLSAQTAKATDEIAQQISGVQSTTDLAVGFLRDVSQSITEVSGVTHLIAAAIEDQDRSTQAITEGIARASTGSRQASHSVVRMRESIGDTEQEAARVNAVSDQLTRVAEQLRAAVEHFLNSVAADVDERRADLMRLMARERAAADQQQAAVLDEAA